MFYRPYVDIASTKSMWNFLHDHFTYPTMNSWNRSTSIAHNVKLYNLNLEGDYGVVMNYLFDEMDSGCLQVLIATEIRDFERKNPAYRAGFNGRSGGYLVLYNADSNSSVLPEIVTDYDSYEDFKADVKDMGYNVSDFNHALREVVEIVREFDRLCDHLRDIVNEFSLRNFGADKLEAALEGFDALYGEDMDRLGLTLPVMEGDHLVLNDCGEYITFFDCYLRCLGEDISKVEIIDGKLYLKDC